MNQDKNNDFIIESLKSTMDANSKEVIEFIQKRDKEWQQVIISERLKAEGKAKPLVEALRTIQEQDSPVRDAVVARQALKNWEAK